MASPQWRRGQRSEGHASAKRVRFDLPRVHGQWPGTIRGAEPTAGSSFVVGNYITDKTTLTRLRLHQTHPANDSTPQAAQNLQPNTSFMLRGGSAETMRVLSCDVMVGGEAGVCGRVEGAGPLPPPVVPAKAGTHPWLAMLPRSVESRPDRRGCRESRGWPPAQGRGDGCASESGPSLERHEMSWSVMRCHGRHASADALPFRSCIPRLPCTSFQSSPPAAVPDAAGPFFARILRGCGRVSAPARFAHLITRARRRTHFPCPFPPGFSAPAAFCRKRKRRPRKPPFLHPSYHTFPQVKPLAGRF